jgi:hypothetical protein
MKKTILLIVILFTGSIGYSQSKNKIKGSREVVTESKDLDKKFNALEVSDNITVSISTGNKNTYVLKTDANLVDEVQFIVINNVLKISTSKKISNFKELEVNLQVVEINRIILKDDAIVKTDKTLKCDYILVDANNSSKFDLEIEADDIQVNMYKNSYGKISFEAKNLQLEMNDRTDLKGKIDTDKLKVILKNKAELTLSGDSKDSEFRLENSADLDAKKMDSRNAVLFSSNSSDVYLKVSRNLDVTSDGKSKIYVYGKGDVHLKGFTDKSQIIKK